MKYSFPQLSQTFFIHSIELHISKIYVYGQYRKVVTPLLWVFAFFLQLRSRLLFFAGKSSNPPSITVYRDALKVILHQYFFFILIFLTKLF